MKKLHSLLMQMIRCVACLLSMSVLAFSQDTLNKELESYYDHPNVKALYELRREPRVGENFDAIVSRYKLALRNEVLFRKILAILIENKNILLEPNDFREPAVTSAMDVLQFSPRDEVIEAIAPYLKNQSPRYQVRVAGHLRVTQNPKAVPYLIAALLEVEKKLPPTLSMATSRDRRPEADTFDLLDAYFGALSVIGSEDALIAMDATLSRLETKYRASELGPEFVRRLKYVKDTRGNGDFIKFGKGATAPIAPSVNSAPHPAPEPTALPSPESQPKLGTGKTAPIESEEALWPWVLSSAVLIIVALILWKRR